MEALPSLFAIINMDMGVDPMTYHMFITSCTGYVNQKIYNISSPHVYTEDVSQSDGEYRPVMKSMMCIYEGSTGTPILFTYWDTGMTLVSSTETVPIYHFKDNAIVSDTSNPLSPIYASSTNCLRQLGRKDVVRRQISMFLATPPRHGATLSSFTPPPVLRRVSTSSFSVPLHAADAIVRTLISDKSACSITTSEFTQIPVIGITPCFHCFDYESLQTWLSSHSTCPECRTSVTSTMRYTNKVTLVLQSAAKPSF